VDNKIRWVGDPFRREPATPVESVEADLNEIRYFGSAVGLTAAQVDELVEEWTDWWGVGPQTHLDFAILSSSVAARAWNQPWRPGEVTR
jgi:hypothetical protein